MSNLREAMGEEAVTQIIEAGSRAYDNPEIREFLPPLSIRRALVEDLDTDETVDWYNKQRGLQARAAAVKQHLEQPTRTMALAGELPDWMGKRWAEILFSDWGIGLERAVEEAEEWLRKTTNA
jgi:hypothetical protein